MANDQRRLAPGRQMGPQVQVCPAEQSLDLTWRPDHSLSTLLSHTRAFPETYSVVVDTIRLLRHQMRLSTACLVAFHILDTPKRRPNRAQKMRTWRRRDAPPDRNSRGSEATRFLDRRPTVNIQSTHLRASTP